MHIIWCVWDTLHDISRYITRGNIFIFIDFNLCVPEKED